jgi:hypothetical protein
MAVSKHITSNRLIGWNYRKHSTIRGYGDHAAFFIKKIILPSLWILYQTWRCSVVAWDSKSGQLKNHEVIPDHHLALSSILHPGILSIEYNLDDAIHFLKKDILPNNTTTSGYYLAKYQGLALGWLKSVPYRLNNLYPLQNRIMGNFEKRKSN